jgi:CBS domain-containing protein
MTLVKDRMTTDLITVSADAPLTEAARKMRDHDIGDVLVELDEGLAIVTDRDLVVRGLAEQDDTSGLCVGDVCTRDVRTVSPDDDLEDVIRKMAGDDVRRVPVVEDGRAVGILSLGDVAVMRDADSVLADISAAPSNN